MPLAWKAWRILAEHKKWPNRFKPSGRSCERPGNWVGVFAARKIKGTYIIWMWVRRQNWSKDEQIFLWFCCRDIARRCWVFVDVYSSLASLLTRASFYAEAGTILDLWNSLQRKRRAWPEIWPTEHDFDNDKNSLGNKSSRLCAPARGCDTQKMQGDIQTSRLIYI